MKNPYLAIARLEHWTKNAFVLPGVFLAEFFTSEPILYCIVSIGLALLATCIISSANYTINEWLDREYDRFHPTKKNRPAVVGNLNPSLVYLQYIFLLLAGLTIAWFVNQWVFVACFALALQGFFYNVEPFRTKDRIFIDVISESINNPIRLIIGWAAVNTTVFPPTSILVGYWFFGAFLMDIKRYAEYRFIGNADEASLYRRSFEYYTENKLLLVAIFYALCSGFFFAVFMVKHRIELILALPFVAGLYTWYLAMGLKKDSSVMNPESIPYREPLFMAYFIFVSFGIIALLMVDIPAMEWFMSSPANFNPMRIFSM
jgi:decaprenyl-phosphate phosphoribosyltransferase